MFEKIALRSASVAVLAASLLGAGISTASAENLKVAADVGFAPFVMRNANGRSELGQGNLQQGKLRHGRTRQAPPLLPCCRFRCPNSERPSA